MLGEHNKLIRQASGCFRDGYVGIDFLIKCKLSKKIFSDTKSLFAKTREDTSPDAAYRAFNNLFIQAKRNDFIICPDGYGNYAIGKITGDYYHCFEYDPKDNPILPHRRRVTWQLNKGLPRSNIGKLSVVLYNQLVSRGATVKELDKVPYQAIVEIADADENAFKNFRFARLNIGHIPKTEKILGDYLENYWKNLSVFQQYEPFKKDGILPKALSGKAREFPTPAGNIDLLVMRKDHTELMVVEFKRCRSDGAIDQVLRYMGQLRSMIKDESIKITGCIIGHGEDDDTLCSLNALDDFCGSSCVNIDFYCYQINKISPDQIKISDLTLHKIDFRKNASGRRRT